MLDRPSVIHVKAERAPRPAQPRIESLFVYAVEEIATRIAHRGTPRFSPPAWTAVLPKSLPAATFIASPQRDGPPTSLPNETATPGAAGAQVACWSSAWVI